jgi:hypothetical protein
MISHHTPLYNASGRLANVAGYPVGNSIRLGKPIQTISNTIASGLAKTVVSLQFWKLCEP